MSYDFANFDKNFNHDSLKAEYAEAKKGGDYPEIPVGKYEVAVRSMELKLSKKGDPMLAISFRILEGTYKKQLIFHNQVVVSGIGIHSANQLMRKLVPEMKEAIEWEDSYKRYADLIEEVSRATKDYEYIILLDKTEKGYKTISVEDIFQLED